MVLNIKVYEFRREFDFRDAFFSFTESVSCNPKASLVETIRECLPGFDEIDINLYDTKSCSPLYYADFDYFYGPVEFGKYLLSMTVEQYLAYIGEEDTICITFDEIGGMGGGNDLQDIVDLIMKFNELVNFGVVVYGTVKFGSTLVSKAKKALKKYSQKGVQYSSFLNFIYSKEFWTLEDLKITLETNDEEAIDFIMKICLFGYDKKREIYKHIEINTALSATMIGLSIPHQIEILRGYYESIRISTYGVDGNYRKYIIDRIVYKLDVSITTHEIEEIFTEMDTIRSRVFPKEYPDINHE